jgi:hypothetical protein
MKKSGWVILALLVVSGCGLKGKSGEAKQDEKPKEEIKEDVKPETKPDNQNSVVADILVEADYKPPFESAMCLIESVEIAGDILTVKVQYTGGCAKHEFVLHTPGGFMKSVPPQIMVSLFHNAKNESCKAIVDETVQFNIRKIRYPGGKYGKVMVRLEGWKDQIPYIYPEGEE